METIDGRNVTRFFASAESMATIGDPLNPLTIKGGQVAMGPTPEIGSDTSCSTDTPPEACKDTRRPILPSVLPYYLTS